VPRTDDIDAGERLSMSLPQEGCGAWRGAQRPWRGGAAAQRLQQSRVDQQTTTARRFGGRPQLSGRLRDLYARQPLRSSSSACCIGSRDRRQVQQPSKPQQTACVRILHDSPSGLYHLVAQWRLVFVHVVVKSSTLFFVVRHHAQHAECDIVLPF